MNFLFCFHLRYVQVCFAGLASSWVEGVAAAAEEDGGVEGGGSGGRSWEA